MAFFQRKPKNGYNSYDDEYDSSFNRGSYEEDEEDVIDGLDEADQPLRPAPQQPAPVVPEAVAEPAPAAPGAPGFALLKPRGYQDGPEIVRFLKKGCGTVLNIEDVDAAEAQRLIVFLLGALEAMEGELKRVNKTTFALAPRRGMMQDGSIGQ